MCLLPLYSSLCVSVVSLSIAVFRLEVPMAFSSDISNYLSTYITMTLFLYLTSYYSYLFHMCFTSLPPTIQGRSAALVSLSSDRCLVACTRLSPSRVCIFRWVRRQALSLGLPTYLLHTFIHTYIHTYIHYIHANVCGNNAIRSMRYLLLWVLKSVSLLLLVLMHLFVEVSVFARWSQCMYLRMYLCMYAVFAIVWSACIYVRILICVRRQAWSLELPSYTVCIHTCMHTHIHTYVCVWTVFVCHRHGVYVLTTSMYVCSDVLVGNFLTVCIYVVWSATFLLFHTYIYAYTHTYTYL